MNPCKEDLVEARENDPIIVFQLQQKGILSCN